MEPNNAFELLVAFLKDSGVQRPHQIAVDVVAAAIPAAKEGMSSGVNNKLHSEKINVISAVQAVDTGMSR